MLLLSLKFYYVCNQISFLYLKITKIATSFNDHVCIIVTVGIRVDIGPQYHWFAVRGDLLGGPLDETLCTPKKLLDNKEPSLIK